MLHAVYALLLAAALFCNRRDGRMLALTCVIGVSVFIPVPRETALQFYMFCIAAELVVAFLAIAVIRARASEIVATACVVLVAVHVMGYITNGYPPLSGYRILVPLLESVELLACLCLSPALYPRLRNRSP